MGYKAHAVLLVALFCAADARAESTLIQQAANQFLAAQKAEAHLYEESPADRTRAEYLKVIKAYERVYLITPHTGYADNALTTMARLYEEINDARNAIKTLQFLLHEYPQTPFRDVGERDIVRLSGSVEVNPKEAAVENIRYWAGDDTTRIVVDITGDFTFKQGAAKAPDRVFIDISPARLNSMLIGKEWAGQSPPFEKIRIAQYTGSTVRVVLDGSTLKRVHSFELRDPSRLVIDVTSADPPTDLPPAALVSQLAGKPPLIRPAVERVGIVTPAKPTSRGDRSLIRSLGLKISRVIIDPGHGGHDTGSIGPSGFTEKDLVLDVARRLKALIETDMGIEVAMTRSDDTFVPLESRTELANKQEADLFISIHANSSQTRNVRGVETFFLNLNTQSREALTTATRENAASEMSIHEQQDVLMKIMLNDKVDESRELAQHIQTAMSKRKDAGPNRGVKQAPFVVLIGAKMPSILAEITFISNPEEERQLKTPQYRQQIAESLLQGVRSYAETLSGMRTAKSQEKN